MARQLNTTMKGKIGDYSFYHDSLHGFLVRRTGGVTSKQYRTDQRYAAARDASSEFAAVSKTGKLIRTALKSFIDEVKDSSMANRLNKELVAIKQLDNQNPRGKRRPETKIGDEIANRWLRIFQFNDGMNIYDLINNPSEQVINPSGHAIDGLFIDAFPKGATHARLTLVRTVIDFGKKNSTPVHHSKK